MQFILDLESYFCKMGILVKKTCIVQAVLLLFISGVYGADDLKCTGTTFYRVRENGQAWCRECRGCIGGGIGWNISVTRKEDEHGFRSCYPCARCPHGTYRELDSADPKCQPCTLDCRRLHRFGSVQCGGAFPGHCGACRNGYKADSVEQDSMCTLKPTTQETVRPTTARPELVIGQRASIPGERSDYQREENVSNPLSVWIPAGFLLLLILIALALGAVYAARCMGIQSRNKKKIPPKSAEDAESSKALFSSGSSGSSFGEDNVEIDGIEKVRGECPQPLTCEELEAICNERYVPRKQNEIRFVGKYYTDRILGKDDKTLSIVASSIHGERRYELFQTYLKIEKSKTDPEEEKWHKGITSFPVYILEVLKIWLQKADKDATLRALCYALHLANFDDIVTAILELPENKVPPTNVEIKDSVEIAITDE